MAPKTENTAAGHATLRPDSSDKYSPTNLMNYNISLAMLRTLVSRGVFTMAEYRWLRGVLNKKYGFSSDSIFADTA